MSNIDHYVNALPAETYQKRMLEELTYVRLEHLFKVKHYHEKGDFLTEKYHQSIADYLDMS